MLPNFKPHQVDNTIQQDNMHRTSWKTNKVFMTRTLNALEVFEVLVSEILFQQKFRKMPYAKHLSIVFKQNTGNFSFLFAVAANHHMF